MRVLIAVLLAGMVWIGTGAPVRAQQAHRIPNKSCISVNLRAVQPSVQRIEDLLLSLSVVNTSTKPVRMLFDVPTRRDFGPWMTRCIVRNSKGDTVQRHQTKLVLERKEYTPLELDAFRFDLRAQDWKMRLYALTDLTVLDDRKFEARTGKLPPGRYTVQVFFYDIPSDVVAFELKAAPATPPATPQKRGS